MVHCGSIFIATPSENNRTPIAEHRGIGRGIRTDDIAALPLKALMQCNAQADWAALDNVILGCANQAGEDNRNVARMQNSYDIAQARKREGEIKVMPFTP